VEGYMVRTAGAVRKVITMMMMMGLWVLFY
jgi:hypothetical protein